MELNPARQDDCLNWHARVTLHDLSGFYAKSRGCVVGLNA
jgi:hypothetical protein